MIDTVWRWLGTAPPKVIIIIVIFLAGGFSSWLYTVEGHTNEIRTQVALAVEQVRVAAENQHATNERLDKLDEKIGQLIVGITELQVELRRSRYQTRYPNWDMQPQPYISPSPNPLTGRRGN